ncbi:ribonuclease P protein component [Candidatus Nomurabacteria bacterium]|nr:ribonuclease P protein component [Candidatus Nomurabacteria bacterium]
MLARFLRLDRPEIELVVARGRRFGNRDLGLRVLKVGHSPSRFAIVVPAKEMKQSVDRHLIKRRIRSVIRSLAPRILLGFHIVVFCGSATVNWSFAELKKSFVDLLKDFIKKES